MKKPKVSIVVPVYNVEKYLQCCMDSLLNQTLTDIEIILVDDRSPDNCPALCDSYAKQDDRVKVIHKNNAGLGYARNSGMEIATGEYIAFVDSDDYVERDTYQKVYSLAMEKKADVVYFTYRRFDDGGTTWKDASHTNHKQYNAERDIRGLMLDMIANPPTCKNDRDIQVSSCCALYRNSLIKQHDIQFHSERELISEDLLFNLDYLLHAGAVSIIPEALYNYRDNQSSLTRKVRADRVEKNRLFYQYLKEWLRANKFGLDGYLRATRLFIGYSRFGIRQYIQSSIPGREKREWLKKVANNNLWREIASSYPYKQLPLKYALHFYLLHKRFTTLLYYYSK